MASAVLGLVPCRGALNSGFRPRNKAPLNSSFFSVRESRSLDLPRRSFVPQKSDAPNPRPCVATRALLPVDPWAPGASQSIASSLFAVSLFPYIGFLYFLTKSRTSPRITLFGFYFLLAFVGATIPAGIYAKMHYGTSLSNVDYLHGGAESLLTVTNLFIVLGLRDALRKQASEGTEERGRMESGNVTAVDGKVEAEETETTVQNR